jgi:hypothetical protein
MQLFHKTHPILIAPHINQVSGDISLTDDVRQGIERCSSVLGDPIRGKPAGKQSKNGTDSLSPHTRKTSSRLHDPEDLRALREWVKAKRIHERQTEPVAAGFPAPPWKCG